MSTTLAVCMNYMTYFKAVFFRWVKTTYMQHRAEESRVTVG